MFPKFPLSLFMRSKVPATKGNNNDTTNTTGSTGNGNGSIGEGRVGVLVGTATTPPPLTPSKASTAADPRNPSGGSYPGLIVQKLNNQDNNNGTSKSDGGRSESVPAFGPVTTPSPVRVPSNSSPVKFILIPARLDPTPTTSRAHTLLAIPTYSKKPAAVVSHNSAPVAAPVPVAADDTDKTVSTRKRVSAGFALAAKKLSFQPLVKKRKRSSSPAAAAGPYQQNQHEHRHISFIPPAEQPQQQTLSGRLIKQKKVFDPSDCLYEKSPKKREGAGGKKVKKEQQARTPRKGSAQQLLPSERIERRGRPRRPFPLLVNVKVEPEEVIEEESFDYEEEEVTTEEEETEVETKNAADAPPAFTAPVLAPVAIPEITKVEGETKPTSSAEPKVGDAEAVAYQAAAAAAAATTESEPTSAVGLYSNCMIIDNTNKIAGAQTTEPEKMTIKVEVVSNHSDSADSEASSPTSPSLSLKEGENTEETSAVCIPPTEGEVTNNNLDQDQHQAATAEGGPGPTAPIKRIQQQQMSPTIHDNNQQHGNVDTDNNSKQVKVQHCDKEIQTTSGSGVTDGSRRRSSVSLYSWTVEDVVQFFYDSGFHEEAIVFREQEIDGLALVMMRRSDVLYGLKLFLGPALKIYRLIVQLQAL